VLGSVATGLEINLTRMRILKILKVKVFAWLLPAMRLVEIFMLIGKFCVPRIPQVFGCINCIFDAVIHSFLCTPE
jgi:hypothetical protein